MTQHKHETVAELLDECASLSLSDMARSCGVQVDVIIEMVEHDVLSPQGARSDEWRFPATHLVRVRRALRLRRDLELNWAGVCLAIELLDELNDLRRRHRALLRRLG